MTAAPAAFAKAPFPYFGGKKIVSELVWNRLGNPANYIEPFAGSAAVLLTRPSPGKVETLNDFSGFISNFWRAIKADPEAVAKYADWPVNEADLHARHRFLVGVKLPDPIVPPPFDAKPSTRAAYLAGFRGLGSDDAAAFREKIRTDPEFHDARFAGWWAWGACCWIGSGWCDDVELREDGTPREKIHGNWMRGVNQVSGPSQKLPDISGHHNGTGRGLHQISGPTQKRPMLTGGAEGSGTLGKGVHGNGRVLRALGGDHRPQLADAYARGRGVHGNDRAETCDDRALWLEDWFAWLSDRLRVTRVCCGDWLRVCGSPSVTTRIGTTGIFLDPPYAHDLARLHAWISHLLHGTPPPEGGTAKKNRAINLYANDSTQDVDLLVARVHVYCVQHGANPKMRLALCGYSGEHDALEALGWSVVEWKSGGGYSNRGNGGKGNGNSERERVWFSPHCLDPNRNAARQLGLFAESEG